MGVDWAVCRFKWGAWHERWGGVAHYAHYVFDNMHNILKYVKAYQKVFMVLVKQVLIVYVLTSLWSVLVKFINNVFTKTLG